MESGDEDELTTGARDFVKMREKLFKAAYVEGVTKAQDEAAEKLDSRCNPWLINAFTEVGKITSVLHAAMEMSEEREEGPEELGRRLELFSTSLTSLSPQETGQEFRAEQMQSQVQSFIQDLKTLYPDAACLIESLFHDPDAPPPLSSGCCGGAHDNCSSANTTLLSKDMRKLNF